MTVAAAPSPLRKELVEQIGLPVKKRKKDIEFPSYRLVAGVHRQIMNSDLEDCAKVNKGQTNYEKLLVPTEVVRVPPTIVTPQSIEECLLMEQNPDKFAPLGHGETSSEARIAELMALLAERDRELAEARERIPSGDE